MNVELNVLNTLLTTVSDRVIDSILAQQHNIRHIDSFQPRVTFHIDTSHLICTANQMASLYMKCNNGLKLVSLVVLFAINCREHETTKITKAIKIQCHNTIFS